jgi:hypothetical protein
MELDDALNYSFLQVGCLDSPSFSSFCFDACLLAV